MAKWKLITLIIILMLPAVMATVCEVSDNGNVTWRNVTTVYEGSTEAAHYGIPQATEFCVRCRNSTGHPWGYACGRTKEGSDTAMTSLAVTLFLGGITLGLFLLPFIMRFAQSEALNVLWKRMIWIAGFGMLAIFSAMLTTMADNAGLGVTNHMLTFVWFFHRGLYVLMIILFASFFFTIPKLLKVENDKKRMGET